MEALYPNALGLILLLLCFQRQLDKQLLELLIAVVYTELFKTRHTHTDTHMFDSCFWFSLRRFQICCIRPNVQNHTGKREVAKMYLLTWNTSKP